MPGSSDEASDNEYQRLPGHCANERCGAVKRASLDPGFRRDGGSRSNQGFAFAGCTTVRQSTRIVSELPRQEYARHSRAPSCVTSTFTA